MVSMFKLMSGAESLAVRTRIRTDVDDGAIPVSNDLRFTVRKAPVFHLDADAMRDRLQLDVGRVRDPQFREKLFGRTHATLTFQIPVAVDHAQAQSCVEEHVQ